MVEDGNFCAHRVPFLLTRTGNCRPATTFAKESRTESWIQNSMQDAEGRCEPSIDAWPSSPRLCRQRQVPATPQYEYPKPDSRQVLGFAALQTPTLRTPPSQKYKLSASMLWSTGGYVCLAAAGSPDGQELSAMDNNESPLSVAPPRYTKTDPHQKTPPPYRKNEEEPLATPPQLLGDRQGVEIIVNAPKKHSATKQTRKKQFWIVGSLVLLAIIIAASTSGGYYAKQAIDGDRFVADPSKTGIQPDSRGPPVVALADGFNRRMSGYSNRDSNNYEVWLWHVSNNSILARMGTADANRAAWETKKWETAAESTRFLMAPILASGRKHGTGGLALTLEASSGALLSCYSADSSARMQDCFWQSLGGRFTNPPTAVLIPWHKAQVYVVTENGHLWRRCTKKWSRGIGEWPSRPTWLDWEHMGDGFSGELSPCYLKNPDYRAFRLAAVRRDTYQVLDTELDTESRPEAWEDYGRPPLCTGSLGAPKLFSIGWSHIGILVACSGRLWHKPVVESRDIGGWHFLEAPGGENLTHSVDTQMLLGEKGWMNGSLWWSPITTPYLVSRTIDHCYYATAMLPSNETAGDGGVRGAPWRRLWCQTEEQKGLATAVACDEGLDTCYMYREDADGRILRAISQPLVLVDGVWTTSTTELEWESLNGRPAQ